MYCLHYLLSPPLALPEQQLGPIHSYRWLGTGAPGAATAVNPAPAAGTGAGLTAAGNRNAAAPLINQGI
jgi:hypothetical protein